MYRCQLEKKSELLLTVCSRTCFPWLIPITCPSKVFHLNYVVTLRPKRRYPILSYPVQVFSFTGVDPPREVYLKKNINFERMELTTILYVLVKQLWSSASSQRSPVRKILGNHHITQKLRLSSLSICFLK